MTVPPAVYIDVILPDATGGRVLVVDALSPALPCVPWSHARGPLGEALNAAVFHAWGVRVAILRPLGETLALLENLDPAWSPPPGLRWACPEEVRAPAAHVIALRGLACEPDGARPERRPLWFLPGWTARAERWVDAQVERLGRRRSGPLEQVRHWSLSSVARVPTDTGTLYFKAVLPEALHEPAVMTLLGARWPGQVARVVAQDGRGWHLTEEYRGEPLDRSGRGGGEDALALLATMQRALADRANALRWSGVPAHGPLELAAQIEPFLQRRDLRDPALPRALPPEDWRTLERLAPWLQERCAALAGSALPLTLVHGDLHPGNVVRTDAGPLLHDWSFAAIAHPYVDLACWLDGLGPARASQAIAAYLGAWRGVAPDPVLWQEWLLAKPVGALAEMLKFAAVCDAVEREQWYSWTPMLFGWARRLLHAAADPEGYTPGWE